MSLTGVPRVFGVPRFIFGTMTESLREWVRALAARDAPQRAERALMFVYAIGYVRESRRTRGRKMHEDGLPLDATGPSSSPSAT